MATKEMTADELREHFLKKVWEIIGYWEEAPDKTNRQRMASAIFSVLAEIDGEGVGMPMFALMPIGEDGKPKNCDISGSLHSEFYGLDPKIV